MGEVATGGQPIAVDGDERGLERRGSPAGESPTAENVARRSQYRRDTNAMRSRSRSTTMRVATLCTRPADSRGITFFHRTGDTS